MSIQGIAKLGLGGSFAAEMFNAARNNVMNAFGMPRKLYIQNQGETTPTNQAGIECDLIRLMDPGTLTPALARNVNVTVDITASGANGLDTGARAADTFYWLWIIAKCAAGDGLAKDVAGLASLSASSPTMPAGYTHKRLVGCLLTDSSSNIVPFVQNNYRWSYLEKQLSASDSGNTGWVSQDITALVATGLVEQALLWLWVDSRYASYEGDGKLRTYGETMQFAFVDTDKAEESHIVAWMSVADGFVDYKLTYTTGYIYGDLYVQAFIVPIWQEP